ncbi:MAG: oligosaccharide flippase family protein, partial [Chloroflexi bacterium]|nr:oligosaccharide flippase family protein [Chloroflexota bacterium]
VALTSLILARGGAVLAALIVNLITSVGQLLAIWLIYRWRFAPDFAPPGASLRLIELLRRAWPFAVAALLAALQLRLSIILLEIFAGISAVGIFAAAYRFIDAGRLIPGALFGALLPALAARTADPQQRNRLFRRALIGLAGFGVLAAVGFSVAADPLIALIYGPAFAESASILPLLAWGLLFNLMRGGVTLYLYAVARAGLANRIAAGMIVIQAALSLWLIPTQGVVGAAFGWLVAEIAAVLALWRIVSARR